MPEALALLYDLAILPFKEFFDALNAGERSVLYILLAAAAVLGFELLKANTRHPSLHFKRVGRFTPPASVPTTVPSRWMPQAGSCGSG